jgi:hypothetical protein
MMKENKVAGKLIPSASVPWLSRTFSFTLPLTAFPEIVGRLALMPECARSLGDSLTEQELNAKNGSQWSAKEHIGHLDDLASLDEKRFNEFLDGVKSLSPADMTNKTTELARHNETSWAELVTRLKENRLRLVTQIQNLTNEQLLRTALHVRLRQQMRLLDWLWFVAEHDDHHLAAAQNAIDFGRSRSQTR